MVRLTPRLTGLDRARVAPLDLLRAIPDLALLAGLVVAIEMLGARSLHDGTDLLLVIAVVLTVQLLLAASRHGWLPVTAACVRGVRHLGRALRRRLEPRFALAMRPAPGVSAPQDRALSAWAPLTAALLVAVVVLGPRLFTGLVTVRAVAGTTVYLLLWSAVLVLFLAPISAAAIVATRMGFEAFARGRRRWHVGVLLGAVAALAVGVLACLPGLVAVAATLWLGLGAALELKRLPPEPYRLCRRDAAGSWRVVSLTTFAVRAQLAGTLLCALIAALGQADRLFVPKWPRPPFALTGALGLVASAACLLLAGRLGTWLLRVGGARGEIPERPLVPTLWARDRSAGIEAPWLTAARRHGWIVLRSSDPPLAGFDLVAGLEGHPRAVPEPPDDEAPEDTTFRLARRFHIVHRRAFFRGFERLFKAARPGCHPPGSGFVFAPHIRFLPGMLRDQETPRGTGSALPRLHGPAYVTVFDARSRRYIGSVLRDLEVDVVFFEDAVSWADLKRVWGVLFECYDQRRTPLDPRWFQGLPRVRVLLQAEGAELDREEGATPTPSDPAPALARTLVILRDRGGGDVEADIPSPGSRRRTPAPHVA
ncbi:MAG: hypothetical protein AB7T63_16615 [Planctomycetota bacterium]